MRIHVFPDCWSMKKIYDCNKKKKIKIKFDRKIKMKVVSNSVVDGFESRSDTFVAASKSIDTLCDRLSATRMYVEDDYTFLWKIHLDILLLFLLRHIGTDCYTHLKKKESPH